MTGSVKKRAEREMSFPNGGGKRKTITTAGKEEKLGDGKRG